MKYLTGVVMVALIIAACFSCGQEKKVMSRTELIRYIGDADHGLKQQQEINSIKAEIRYQPATLLAVQSLGDDAAINKKQFDSASQQYNKYYYFLLKFSKQGSEAIRQLGSFSRYSDMVQVFSFQMHRFVNVTTSQRDTVALSDYLFDQTYGMSDGNTILLCFDKTKLTGKEELNVNVAECGLGTGALQFRFRRKDLEKIPDLDYTKLN